MQTLLFEDSNTSFLETEMPFRPCPTDGPGIANRTVQASPAAGISAAMTHSPSDEKEVVRERDLGRDENHSYSSILKIEGRSQPPPPIWSDGMMQALPATSVFTAMTYSSSDANEDARELDFSRDESQRSFILPSQSSSSPAGMIMYRQTADIANGLMQVAYNATGQVQLSEQEFPLDNISAQVQNSPVFTSAGTTDLNRDLTSTRVAVLSSSLSSSLSGANSHALQTPARLSVNRPVDPSGEASSDVPEFESAWGPSPHPISPSALCEFCNQVFNAGRHSRGNLKRHQRQKHLDYRNWKHKCEVPDCGKIYSRSDSLKTHYKNSHKSHEQPNQKIIRCRVRKPDNS